MANALLYYLIVTNILTFAVYERSSILLAHEGVY